MKFNKKHLLVSTLGLLQMVASLAQASGPTAKEIYNGLSGEPSLVEFSSGGGVLVGASVSQKDNPAGRPSFCRSTHPVVPHPTYSYECFYSTRTGSEAEALYAGSNARELGALFRSASNGSILVGRDWKEKYLGSAEATICVKTAPVVPHPVATYTCYSNMGGIGGAVSGGN